MNQKPTKDERRAKAEINKAKKNIQKLAKEAKTAEVKADAFGQRFCESHGDAHLWQGKAARLNNNLEKAKNYCEYLEKHGK
jgi:hypothetical protein